MQDTNTHWLNIRKPQEKDASDFAFERLRLQQAEDLLTSEIPDDLLLNLHLFAMDFEMENACYAVLKRQTEDLLLKRMGGGKEGGVHPFDFAGAEACDDKQALEAAISNALTDRDLVDLFLSAECTRFMDNNGPTWQAVFDLTRLQILRRMRGFRSDATVTGEANIPDDATILPSTVPAKWCAADKFTAHAQAPESASTEWDRNKLGWLEDEWDEDHLASIEGGELGYAREDLRLAEGLYSPELPDDILLRLYRFVMSHGDDEPGIWSVIRSKTKRLIMSRLPGGPKERDAKYSSGFDPKDHALAVEALSNDAIPYPELLTLYEVASTNKGIDEEWNDDAIFASDWAVVFDLLRDKILAMMAAHRAEIEAAVAQNSSRFTDACGPRTSSGDES